MSNTELQYFTHEVDGAVYGAWYRLAPFNHIEVIGVGMLERGEYAGFSPESAARSILETFVRNSIRLGIPMPRLEPAEVETVEADSESSMQYSSAGSKDPEPEQHSSLP
jgi:hypothetical protein